MSTSIKLNHINLPVKNVTETRIFFEKYFDFKCIEVKGNDALAVLKGEGDFVLVLMSEAFNRQNNISYPDAFHVGFLVHEKEQVDHIFKKLSDGGVVLERNPSSMRGVYGFYFNAPGNILVEVSST